MTRAITALLLLTLCACTRNVIPNTDVEDSPEARDVVEFVERYREAVIARDPIKLFGFVSKDYYDDMGTPQGDDDVDFDVLREKLKDFHDETISVHYDIRYRDVVFLPTKVLVDCTYLGRYRINTPEGPRWEKNNSDHRIVLTRKKDGSFMFLSGL